MPPRGNITHLSITTGTMIRTALVGLFFFLIWFLRDVVLVVLTSIVIASFLESAVPYFKKVGIGRVLAIVIIYVLSLLALAGLFYLFVPLLASEVYNISNFLASYFPNVSWLNFFRSEAFSGTSGIVDSISGNLSLSGLLGASKEFALNVSGGFFNAITVAFGGIFNFLLIIVISFYLAIQEKGIENFLRVVVPLRYEEYAVDLWTRSQRKIALWVKGQVMIAAVVAVLTYVALSFLDIKYALVLALMAGAMELVPYGILLAIIPAFSFSYISGGLSSALMVVGAYIIIQQFEAFLFTPLIIEKVVGLTPVVIILSVLVGYKVGGIWGVLLSIPMAVVAMEFVSDVEKNKILARAEKDK